MKPLKERILTGAAADLAAIEKALADNLNPYLELCRTVAHHILFAGGKRMRPLLMVLAARACGSGGPEAVRLSTVFEYLHAASLLHDDVVDDSALRRGKPAAHTVHGAAVTVLVGDFLLARTCSIATETGVLPIIQTITDITGIMSEGEIMQLVGKGDVKRTEADYLDTIERKTAVLLAAACKVGGLFAGADGAGVQNLWNFGINLGIAFQMADDLLDYTGDTKSTGKPVGTDLREGKLTLPLIYALEKAETSERDEIIRIIGQGGFSDDEFGLVLSAVKRHGGLDYTLLSARKHAEKAKELLSDFPDNDGTRLLSLLADYSVERKS